MGFVPGKDWCDGPCFCAESAASASPPDAALSQPDPILSSAGGQASLTSACCYCSIISLNHTAQHCPRTNSDSQWSAGPSVLDHSLSRYPFYMACRRGAAAGGGPFSRGACAAAKLPASIHQGEGPGLQHQQARSEAYTLHAGQSQDV